MKLKQIALLILAIASAAPAMAGPLTISDGKFIKDGKPYYGIGVNYFDGFQRRMYHPSDVSWKAGLDTLQAAGIPFIRVNIVGFWPADIKGNYVDKQAVFFQRLDEFMDAAGARNIGVIMDMFWNWTAYPDMFGEHLPAIGDTNSLARQFIREQTDKIVRRYKDKPAVWAWEFANEASCLMDLPNGNHQWEPTSPSQGSPARTAADDITPANIISALADFAATVKAIDPNTPVFSGNCVPSYNSYHLKTNNWSPDTVAQFGNIMARNEPAPLDTFSIHLYPIAEGAAGKYNYFNSWTTTFDDILAAAMHTSVMFNRPLYLGEFGSDEGTGAAAAQTKFNEMTASILKNRVQLSTLWVFDLTQQNGSYNVTTSNARAYQLQKLQQMNQTMSAW